MCLASDAMALLTNHIGGVKLHPQYISLIISTIVGDIDSVVNGGP